MIKCVTTPYVFSVNESEIILVLFTFAVCTLSNYLIDLDRFESGIFIGCRAFWNLETDNIHYMSHTF